MNKEIGECGIKPVNTQYAISLLQSLYGVKSIYKLNDLCIRLLLLLYTNPSLTQYKMHYTFYTNDNHMTYTCSIVRRLYNGGFVEVVGYSSKAALFGLTEKGVEVVNAVFDGVEGDL